MLAQYKSDLKNALGPAFDEHALEASILVSAIGDDLEWFMDSVRNLQSRIVLRNGVAR